MGMIVSDIPDPKKKKEHPILDRLRVYQYCLEDFIFKNRIKN